MIDTSLWQWFEVGKIFTLAKCKCSNATELLEEGNEIAYIGAKKTDNGVMQYVKRVEELVTRGNCLVFIGDGQGSVGYCIYQPTDFIGSTTLIAGYNSHLNSYIAQFLIAVLDKERYRYSFGRKYRKEVITKAKVLLPAILDENNIWQPYWQYMETFIKQQTTNILPANTQQVWQKQYTLDPLITSPSPLSLSDRQWHNFRFDEIFRIEHGFYNKKPEHIEDGEIPFIGATDSNNGVTSLCTRSVIEQTSQTGDDRYSPIEDKIYEPNCITVSNDGSVGFAFYQNKEFTCSHSVNPLYLKDYTLNVYIAMFLCTIIEKERFRWAYGRKWRPSRMPSSIIRLPIVPNSDAAPVPDWQFMEDYIKSLPYSRNI